MKNTLFPLLFLSCGLAAQDLPPTPKVPREPSVGQLEKLPAPAVEIGPAYEHIAPFRDVSAAAPSPRVLPQKERSIAESALSKAGRTLDTVLFDRPTADGPIWTLGSNYKASFDPTGWTYFAKPAAGAGELHPIRFEVQKARVGAHELAVTAASPRLSEHRIDYSRGGMIESVDIDLQGVEQSFTFHELPSRDEIVVEIRIRSDVGAEQVDGGLRFRSEWLDVGYSAAFAFDATGERIDAPMELHGDTISIRVPANFVANATLPLVIDPRVNNRVVHGGGTDHAEPDVVWDESSGQWHVVYQQYFGGSDWDCYVQRLDADLNLVGSPTTIDLSSSSWQLPRIANLNASNTSMVVAQRRVGTAPWEVVCRTLNSVSVVSGQLVIATSGVDEMRPDIGGDPASAPTFFTVVWQHAYSATDHDIYARQLDSTGTLRGTTPIYVQTSTAMQSWPSISKSNGAAPFGSQRYTIVYQQTASAGNDDIYGAMLTWDGTLVTSAGGGSNFPINTSTFHHVLPQASSPTLIDSNGQRRILVVFESPSSNAGDIVANVINQVGTVIAGANVNLIDSDSTRLAWPQRRPSVDCNGYRFGVGYHEAYFSGADLDTRMTLLASVGSALIANERAAVLGFSGSPEFNMQVASRYASSGLSSPRFCTVHDRDTTAELQIDSWTYDDPSQGSFVVRPTGCGQLSIGHSTSAVPGAQILFSIASGSATPGFLFGVPIDTPLTGLCNGCTLGASGSSVSNNLFSLTVPNSPNVIGTQFAVQGYMFEPQGAACLGQIHLSDTIDVTIQ